MKKPLIVSCSLAAIIVADLVTKHLASSLISPMEPVPILPFFNLVNVHNRGAAFGMFDTLGNGFFIGISIAAIAFILYLLVRTEEPAVPLTLIMAGALGNLIDRLALGYVRDFLDVYAGGWHWPAFNIADSALTVGLILMLLHPLLSRGRPKKETGPGNDVPDAGYTQQD